MATTPFFTMAVASAAVAFAWAKAAVGKPIAAMDKASVVALSSRFMVAPVGG
jgi:hypothetical protein